MDRELLYPMWIGKGMKKCNETILVALVELKADVIVEKPECVGELLK